MRVQQNLRKQVRRIAIQVNTGQLAGPDLEDAIYTLMSRTWEKLDISGRTFQEAIDDRDARPAEYEVTP